MKSFDFAQKSGINILKGFQFSSYANKFDIDEGCSSSDDIFLAASKNCINKSIIF